MKRKLIAQLMANNNGGNLRQALLDSAPFRSSLTYTAVPQSAAPGTTATFTRATTKTVENNDGYLVTLLAGEIGFPGARRVRNLLTFTEDLTNAVHSVLRLTKTNATTLTETAVLGTHVLLTNGSESYVSGNTYALSCRVNFTGRSGWVVFGAGNAGSTIACLRSFNPSLGTFGPYTGDVGATFIGYDIGDVDSEGFARISILFRPAATTAAAGFQLYIDSSVNGAGTVSYTGDTGVSIQATDFQLEDVTAQTTQTAGEYVSVGVESAPYYHGSMVDGVKCFPTDIDGNPLTGMTTPLIELAATNLYTYSQDYDNAAWTKTSITVAANDAVAPDGTTTADKLTNDNTSSVLDRITTVTANTIYSDSVYIKYGNNTWARFLYGSGADAFQAWINLQTGAVGTSSATGTASVSGVLVESAANGFWRVRVAGNLGGVITSLQRRVYLVNADNSGTIVSGAYAHHWGAQLELGTAATSYIPTTTVAATRNADQLYYTGADIANIKAIAAVDFKRESGFSAAAYITMLSDNTANEYHQTILTSATGVAWQSGDGGVTQYNRAASNAYTPGTLSSVAVSFATNDVKFSKDGVAQTADTSATMPTVSRLEYGMGLGGTQLNGYPGKIYGWTRNLSQSELMR